MLARPVARAHVDADGNIEPSERKYWSIEVPLV
jgi:hypothetical protein